MSSAVKRMSITNIVREQNREDNLAQEKDVEIDRLRTTAFALNTQVNITDEMKNQNQNLVNESKILRDRVA